MRTNEVVLIMARYRKVDPRIWNDAKFMALSNNGKLVFFFLLTHPNMTALGAMRGNIPGLSAEIGWTEKAFREAFQEGSTKGMVLHNEKASFFWLPKFMKYNRPESPNVVKAWASSVDLLPECDLLFQAISTACSCAEGLGEAFAEALPKAFAKTMPYQEQEQEQEQEHEQKQDIETTSCSEVSDQSERNVVMSIPLNIKDTFFEIMQKDVEGWIESFPAVDVMGELRKCRQWNIDNPKKRKTKAGIRGHISSWLGRRQDDGPKRSKTISPPVSVKDVQFLQNDAIARALNEDDRRKSQHPGPYGREEGCLLVESQVPFAEKQRALGQN
jgi:hypothetical protein